MGNKKACHMAEFAMFVRILVTYHERLLIEQRKVMELCVTRWQLGRQPLGLLV